MVGSHLRPVAAEVLQDWGTNTLNSRFVDALIPGCVVRVTLEHTELPNSWEKIYFRIVKIKDGTYWGEAMDTYRTPEASQGKDTIGIADGEIMTFRKIHLAEIPMGKLWQPKAYVKAVKSLPMAAEAEDPDANNE